MGLDLDSLNVDDKGAEDTPNDGTPEEICGWGYAEETVAWPGRVGRQRA